MHTNWCSTAVKSALIWQHIIVVKVDQWNFHLPDYIIQKKFAVYYCLSLIIKQISAYSIHSGVCITQHTIIIYTKLWRFSFVLFSLIFCLLSQKHKLILFLLKFYLLQKPYRSIKHSFENEIYRKGFMMQKWKEIWEHELISFHKKYSMGMSTCAY